MAQLAQLKALERGAVKSALDIGVLEGTRNADYIMQGSTAIQPSEVSDNGQFTVMRRSEEHTSELQSLMRTSYAVFCLKTKTAIQLTKSHNNTARTTHTL